MTKLEHALALAAEGFHVFPLVPNSKLPLIDAWQKKASRDPETIRRWWTCPVMGIEQDYNIGVSTSRFGDDKALVVIDVDNKGGKHGDDRLLELELAGRDFPATFEALTPLGGRHLIYLVDKALRQGANVLAAGLDIRSRGGFIVGVGSTIDGREYVRAGVCGDVSRAPSWLVDQCADTRPDRPESARTDAHAVDPDRAALRAIEYLAENAPLAVEGQGGDQTTFQVAARLKDFGVTEAAALILMSHWNERCQPPWSPDELKTKIGNAYRYGREQPGSAAPEVQFEPVSTESGQTTNLDKISSKLADAQKGNEDTQIGHPFDTLNKNFAFVLAGGGSHILWETVDAKGRPIVEHLNLTAFHQKFASWTMNLGKKNEPTTELWMKDKRRRSYDGICFDPSAGPEVVIG